MQIFVVVIGLCLNYAWGFSYVNVNFIYLFKFLKLKIGDFEGVESSDIVYFVDFFCFLIPFGISYYIFMRKWLDIKFKKSKTVIISIIVSFIFAMALGCFMIWARSA